MAAAPGVQGLNPESIKRDKHPKWYPPTNKDDKGLMVYNSLTDTKEPFAPKDGRTVKWYTCGPTVYDVSHMGHARAYLTFDIIRRIMEDYFGYQVQYQMNITDIDDKIIKKARVNKLIDDFVAEINGDAAKLEAKIREAIPAAGKVLADRDAQLAKPLPDGTSKRTQEERKTKIEELELKKKQFNETVEKIEKAQKTKEGLLAAGSGVLGELLDAERGSTITDQAIFEAHARKYELTFFEDCDRLGIRPPDVISRVTEVVPEVVDYVQKIIDNGFAYVAESSVFFDTQAFQKAGHNYPKLKPSGEADEETTADEMAEGEGALSKARDGEKRHNNDFAIWKFSKPGEPRWPSPWGDGRPGWHIECSVMASGVLGDNMDIHAGGCDLRFPHHDNELAQAEAYWGHHQWVNYFLHCGHLSIDGLKMSKSLKNFITIRQALDGTSDGKGITPRQMRLLFIQSSWADGMNFSDQSIGVAVERERVLRAFFGSLDVEFRKPFLKAPQGYSAEDTALTKAWTTSETAVHTALCDNFDTKAAFEALMTLVTETNRYLNLKDERKNHTILRKIGRYITRILKVFGVVQGGDEIGLGDAGSSADERLVPAIDALVKFRDDVRTAAREKKPVQEFLPLCDQLRDEYLPPVGIRLEDKPDGSATQWKFDDPAILIGEIQAKKDAAAAARKTKLQNQIEKAERNLAKWAPFETPANQLFRSETDKYAEFDDEGVPVKDAKGEPIPEKALNKLKQQLKTHQKGCDGLAEKGGKEFMQATRDEIAALKKQLAEL